MSNQSESRFHEQDIVDLIERGSRRPLQAACPPRDALSNANHLAMLGRLVTGDPTLKDEQISFLYDKITTYQVWSDTYIQLRLEHYRKFVTPAEEE